MCMRTAIALDVTAGAADNIRLKILRCAHDDFGNDLRVSVLVHNKPTCVYADTTILYVHPTTL